MTKKREFITTLIRRADELRRDIETMTVELRNVEGQLDGLLPDDDTQLLKSTLQQVYLLENRALAEIASSNLTKGIMAAIDGLRGNASLSPVEIATMLGQTRRINSVRSTLIRLFDDGKIDRPGSGKYASKKPTTDEHRNGGQFSRAMSTLPAENQKETGD